ncbi:MAG: DJ-1/PfpI family protein, partial [Spirochaetes bacterium]|nr:DJ-1/PfpI family protein [Spirochaetota bacterium]
FCRGSLVLAAAGVLSGRTMTGHPDYRNDYLAAGARYVDYADRRGKSDAPPPVVDGFLVTSLRSKYYRSATCEAARIAADNARRARADRAGRSSDGSPDGSPDGVPALPLVASAPARSALFAFMLTPDAAREAALLVGSLREWGGAMRDSPVICMAPGGPEAVPAGNRAGLEALGCEIVGFEPDPRIDSFPLAAKAGAAAAAERLASGKADVVVWMDPDTVFVREPSELLLPAGAVVAAKPVHHRLIGRPWGAGSDDFWRAVYAACGAEPSRDFPVTTIIDREPIGAYFNAGLLAVRPGAGVLAAWRDGLASACADPAVLAALTAPARRLFLHQAALAAAVVSVAGPGGFYELSFGYNYPAHMHASCPADLAPKKLDDLYTVRYDRWPAAPGSAGDAIAVPGRMREALTSLLARIPALGSA